MSASIAVKIINSSLSPISNFYLAPRIIHANRAPSEPARGIRALKVLTKMENFSSAMGEKKGEAISLTTEGSDGSAVVNFKKR